MDLLLPNPYRPTHPLLLPLPAPRETARRVWRTLLAIENISHSHACVSKFVQPDVPSKTGTAMRIDDEDLRDGQPLPLDRGSIGVSKASTFIGESSI